MKSLLTLLLIVVAAAVFPYPASLIERRYSRGIYPPWQNAVTVMTNQLPVSLLDALAGLVLLALLVAVVRTLRARGLRAAARRCLGTLAAISGVAYLLFLATWGLNYHRVPLEEKLDFERERITQATALALAATAIERLNEGYAAAHATPLNREALLYAFHDVHAALGSAGPLEPGRPKRSLLQFYFRYAAIDGMTVPGFLEVILNPDLLAVEVPSTLAHEWAHLAGYAIESEANFVSWLACIRSTDALAQYSGWLDAYGHSVRVLPRGARASLPSLDEGPRADLRAIAARYERSSPRVREVARTAYDSYLRANRVEAGIRDYGAVLQLMLGTRFEEGWRPILGQER